MGIFKRGTPSKQEPPDQPGLYRIKNKETGGVEYIGETNSLKRRKSEHFRPRGRDNRNFLTAIRKIFRL